MELWGGSTPPIPTNYEQTPDRTRVGYGFEVWCVDMFTMEDIKTIAKRHKMFSDSNTYVLESRVYDDRCKVIVLDYSEGMECIGVEMRVYDMETGYRANVAERNVEDYKSAIIDLIGHSAYESAVKNMENMLNL